MDVPQVLWTGIHIFHIEARIIIWVSYEAVGVQGLGLFSDISKGAGLEVGQLEFKLVLIWDAGATGGGWTNLMCHRADPDDAFPLLYVVLLDEYATVYFFVKVI